MYINTEIDLGHHFENNNKVSQTTKYKLLGFINCIGDNQDDCSYQTTIRRKHKGKNHCAWYVFENTNFRMISDSDLEAKL